jgi:hypothetical protein
MRFPDEFVDAHPQHTINKNERKSRVIEVI